MTYYQQYDAIVNRYSGLIAQTNAEYDGYKAAIEAKEITVLYTQEDQEEELAANETARTNAIAALNEQKQGEMIELDVIYAHQTQQNGGIRADPIDYDYLNNVIENLDFSVPESSTYTQQDLENIANVMEALPATVYNTKYIYLTLDNKYNALVELSDQEHTTYSDAYDAIVNTYSGYADDINAEYDGYKTTIEAKEITEQYTQQDQQDELAANETARTSALEANETAKNNEIEPLNQTYLTTLTTIGKAFTDLKTDKETGFMGDVHINGDLHVDQDVNIEGKLNNVLIANYLTTTNLQTINAAIALKADSSHNHDSSYATINHNHDTDYAALNHTHTTFSNTLTMNVDVSSQYTNALTALAANLTTGYAVNLKVGKANSTRQCALYGYVYNSDTTKARATIGLYGYNNLLTIYYNKVESTNSITAPNLKADNETRLVAVESGLVAVESGLTTHNHDTVYASINHNHDSSYAATSHTHSISNITNLQTTLDGKAALDNNSIHYYFTALRSQTWGHTTKYKMYTLGYIKSPNVAYRVFIGNIHVSVNCTSNISEEFDVVIRFGSGGTINGLSLTGNSLITNDKGKSGIGLVLTDSTNMYYALSFYCDGYNNIDGVGCQINCVLPKDLKLYSDSACTTAQSQERSGYNMTEVNKEGYTFDSIYWNEETRALTTHTHSVSDLTDYTPYDDTAVLTYIATNASNIATHNHDTSYASINHNHDTSYAAINHNHDTEYAAISHTHSISNITNLQTTLDGKASTSHNHDSSYAAINHNHNSLYSSINHNHDTDYAAINHNHDSSYSALNHTHSTFTDITVSTINGTRINEYTGGQSHAALGTVPVIPVIKNDSVMEVGKYIDFHDTNDNSADNSVRLTASSSALTCNKNVVASNITSTNNTRLTACENKLSMSQYCRDLAGGVKTYDIYEPNTNPPFPTTIKNVSNTKTISINNTCVAHETAGWYSITVDFETVNLDGPDSWNFYINGNLECALTVEHQYYRNASNDNKYLTQSVLLELFYPVGTIYTSTVNRNPAGMFGGTWTQIVNRFLYATAGASKQTGGEETHTLTTNEIPQHTHQITFQGYYNFAHGDHGEGVSEYRIDSDPREPGSFQCDGGNCGGQAHNNMPPYMTVYAWERTA